MLQSSVLNNNPFAVLTAIVAPAVLTNACSVLCLGTGNRIARAVDRTRILAAEMGDLEPGSTEYQFRLEQLDSLRARAAYLFRALRLLYTALGGFAAAALISIMGSTFALYQLDSAFHVMALLALISGVSATGALVIACTILVTEVRVAIRSVANEANHIIAHYTR